MEKKYLSLTSGFPLFSVSKNEKLKAYKFNFADTSTDYVIWVSTKPFSSTGHPNDDTNCIKLYGTSGAELTRPSNCTRGYKISSGTAISTDVFENISDDITLYIKWGKYNATKADIGGGTLMPEKTGIFTSAG